MERICFAHCPWKCGKYMNQLMQKGILSVRNFRILDIGLILHEPIHMLSTPIGCMESQVLHTQFKKQSLSYVFYKFSYSTKKLII